MDQLPNFMFFSEIKKTKQLAPPPPPNFIGVSFEIEMAVQKWRHAVADSGFLRWGRGVTLEFGP